MVLRANPQKREEKERVRHALLRAALALAAEHGFASLGLREVARAAEIAPTSFYRHFTDMPELGAALVEELVRPLLRSLVLPVQDASGATATLVDRMLVAVVEDAELVRFLVAERVGAFANLRVLLARALDELTHALHAPAKVRDRGARSSPPAHVLDATIALTLDGFARALDTPAGARHALRERMIATLAIVLGGSASEPRQV